MKRTSKLTKLSEEINKELYRLTGIEDAYGKYAKYLPYESVFDFSSLVFVSGIASKGFMKRGDTSHFMHHKWVECYKLYKELSEGRYRPKFYKKKDIYERGKIRTIRPPEFRCKVVQKVVSNYILRPGMEHSMIRTNYATVTGRGTDLMYKDIEDAVNRAFKMYGREGVVVKTDFSGYFASIPKDGLVKLYDRYVTDRRITDLCMEFDKGEEGLTLGNETSQTPATSYPGLIDHNIKDKMGVKFFWRYMDDTMAILPDEENADGYIESFKDMTKSLGLKLKPEKISKKHLGDSFVFCKERFVFGHGQYYRLCNPQRIRNTKKKIKTNESLVKRGKIEKKEADNIVKGMICSIGHEPYSKKIVEKLQNRVQSSSID